MTELWHYTCRHAAAKIGRRGELVPAAQLVAHTYPTGRVVWLTDLSVPIRDALGLTSELLECDRIERRYRVLDPSGALRWVDVRREWMDMWRSHLEQSPGARPAHWWVHPGPVPVELVPS